MTAVLAALTLLPAVLAIVGMRIDALRVRPPYSDDRARHELWARSAARIARKPLAGEGRPAALAILVPLIISLFSLSLGQQDVAAVAKSTRRTAPRHGHRGDHADADR